MNEVNPAATQSDMLDRSTGVAESDIRKQLAAMHPIGRIAQAEEIADAVIFFKSPKASLMTGQGLSIDGLWTAH